MSDYRFRPPTVAEVQAHIAAHPAFPPGTGPFGEDLCLWMVRGTVEWVIPTLVPLATDDTPLEGDTIPGIARVVAVSLIAGCSPMAWPVAERRSVFWRPCAKDGTPVEWPEL